MNQQGELPKKWQKVKLGEVMTLHRGYDLPIDKIVKGKYPVIFSNGKIEYHTEFKKKGPGIITGRSGALGNVFYIEDNYWPHNTTLFIDNFHNNYPKFLYYLLKSLNFSYLNSGTGVPTLNRNFVHELQVIIPKVISDQKAIAGFLSALDDKIEINTKITNTLRQMAQTIFKRWFVDFKFPGYQKAKFIGSELGKIPEGWKVKKIKDIAMINKGVSYSSKEISDREGLPMINLANFERGGGFNPSGIKYYSGSYKESNLVKPGDIVIAMTDLTSNREVIGHPARVPSYHKWDKIVISLDVCSLDTQEEYQEFFYYLMLRRNFSYYMASSASGTNVAHLSKSVIEDFGFILPQKEIIEKFRELIKPIFIKRNVVEMENQKLAKMRDLLLPKLMRGEMRV